MSISDWFYHRHYWGVPHRRVTDNRMIQICYECGKEREVRMDSAPPKDLDSDTGPGEIEVGGEDKRLAQSIIEGSARVLV